MRSKKLVWGGIDTPALDYVIPKWELIEAKFQKNGLDTSNASKLYNAIVTAVGSEHKGGEKFTVDKSSIKTLRSLALELEKEIAPLGLNVQCAGGTVNNKLHTTKAILGDKIIAKLYGSVGDDGRGNFILSEAEKSGVQITGAEKIDFTREVLPITRKGEDDRMGAKFPYKEPDSFHDVGKLIEFATSCDYFYLESSLIKFLEKNDFKKLINAMDEADTKIIFAPPTDKAFFLEKKNGSHYFMRDNIDALKHAASKAYIITMNESEAIQFTGNFLFKGNIETRKDKKLVEAVKNVRDEFKKVDEEKYALVTAGKNGSYGISKNYITEADAVKPKLIANTIGAGDSAAATFASYLSTQKIINSESLKNALSLSAKVASLVVGQNSSQVDPCLIRQQMESSIAI